MTLKLYNTLTRKKQDFKPLKGKEVRIYSCGPTVYDFMHIGNLRAFVFYDLLKRWLKFKGYKIKHIMNITDIDDKLIKKSKGKKAKLKKITGKYEKAFFADLKETNIEKADKYPRATEHIKEMAELVGKLMKKGYAYKTSDGVYFSIKKFKNYGKLARLNLKRLKAGAGGRVEADEYDKSNIQDFSLWKFWDKEDREIFWQTKIGKGRPGWHIECSAMSAKYLGQPFDIHTGGIDLIFPHHENEIAQSEAASGKKFVNFWIHNAHLIVEGKKMSKSLRNFYTLKDIKAKNFSPVTLRYFYLTGHYKKQLNFTWKNIKNSENAHKRLREIIYGLRDDKKINKEYLRKFEEAMDDDLDVSSALQVLWEMLRDRKAEGKLGTVKEMDKVLGLDLLKKEKVSVPAEIMKLVREREKLRNKKEWKKADELRKKIGKKGWQIDDTKKGPKLRKI